MEEWKNKGRGYAEKQKYSLEVKSRNLGAEVGPQVGARKSQRLAKVMKDQQQQSVISESSALRSDMCWKLAGHASNSGPIQSTLYAKKSKVMVFSQQHSVLEEKMS